MSLELRSWPNLRDDFFNPFEKEVNRLLNQVFNPNMTSGTNFPPMNVFVNKNDEFVVLVAVPGLSAEDIKIEIIPDQDNSSIAILRVSGQMPDKFAAENYVVYIKELSRTKFSRILRLPDYLVGDPSTELKDGLLTLKWKTGLPPVKAPKVITIK